MARWAEDTLKYTKLWGSTVWGFMTKKAYLKCPQSIGTITVDCKIKW